MIVQRNDVRQKLEDRLAGRIDAAGIAAWAFERFYAIDQGEETVDPEEADVIADILDELMFADDESFALDDADLRRLIARLQQP